MKNNTGSALAGKNTLNITAQYKGKTYQSIRFPANTTLANPGTWATKDGKMKAGQTLEMIYLIDLPAAAKNGGVKLQFPDKSVLNIK